MNDNSINVNKYPIHLPTSDPKYATILRHAQQQLQSSGCATFPQFFTPQAVKIATREASQAASQAFTTDSNHNAFQLPATDATLPPSHPRNIQMRTRVASMAYDELDRHGPLYKLYNNPSFLEFVKSVTNQNELHKLGDPLGACTVNIFKPGWYHAWHFDESEFTTTLCLQQSESGGEFEYTPKLRDDQSIDKCSPYVAAVINAHSEYTSQIGDDNSAACVTTLPPVHTSDFQPGTLQIFAGRYSFHRVKSIPLTSKIDRLVAVLCFSREKNVVNSTEVQKMFWGRTVEANAASVGSSKL
jgi:hypothetical protein